MLKLTPSDIKVLLNTDDFSDEEKKIIKKSSGFLGIFGGKIDDTKYPDLCKKAKEIVNPDIKEVMDEVKKNNEINPPKMFQTNNKNENKLTEKISTTSETPISTPTNSKEEASKTQSSETSTPENLTFKTEISEKIEDKKEPELKDDLPEEKTNEISNAPEMPEMIFMAPSGETTKILTEKEKAELEAKEKDFSKRETPEIEQISAPKSSIDLKEINLDEDTQEENKADIKVSKEPSKTDVKPEEKKPYSSIPENLEFSATPSEEKVENEITEKTSETTPEIKVVQLEANNEDLTEKYLNKSNEVENKINEIESDTNEHTIELFRETLSMIKYNFLKEVEDEEIIDQTIKTLYELDEEIEILKHEHSLTKDEASKIFDISKNKTETTTSKNNSKMNNSKGVLESLMRSKNENQAA